MSAVTCARGLERSARNGVSDGAVQRDVGAAAPLGVQIVIPYAIVCRQQLPSRLSVDFAAELNEAGAAPWYT
ncbi:hypothetical protein GCM10017687_03870 [Streptomyces echinatus]